MRLTDTLARAEVPDYSLDRPRVHARFAHRGTRYDWPHAIVNTTRDGRLMLTRTDPEGVPVGSTMARPGQLIVPAADVECDPARPPDQDRADGMQRGLDSYLAAARANPVDELAGATS